MFKSYSQYINNYDKAIRTLGSRFQSNEKFAKFLQVSENIVLFSKS